MIKQIQKALCEKYQKFHQDNEKDYLLTIVVNQLCRSMCREEAEYLSYASNSTVDSKFTIDGWIVVVYNTQKELFRIVVR